MWSGAATTQAPTAGNVTNPGLNGLPLGDVYGLTYDYDKILGLLNKATTDAYAARETEAKQTENTFYRNMVDTQSATLDTLRQTQAAAVATGASKGIAAAQELSAILGMQEEAGVGATDLANARLNLSEKKQAEMSGNASSALDTSNAIKQAIANMDLTKYGYDVQKLMGDLDYLASLHNSDKTLEGVKYNADKNLQGTQYATDNQPTYSGGNTNYSGGNNNNSPISPINPTNPTAPADDESVKSSTGGVISAQTLDKAITEGGGAATLAGTKYTVKKNDDGTYAITDGSDNGGISGLTWQQVARIQNNNDAEARNANFGVKDMTASMEVNGKKFVAGSGMYVYNNTDKVWYKQGATPDKTISAATIQNMLNGTDGLYQNVDDVIKSFGSAYTAIKSTDGSVRLYSKTGGTAPKATAELFNSVSAGSVSNGAQYTIGNTSYRYDANAGLWVNLSSNAKVTMAAFNKLMRNAAEFRV